MKVFITLYALTSGIYERELTEERGRMAVVEEKGPNNSRCYFSPHWHKSRAEAVKRAEQMRDKKVASMRKSIAKLSDMTW